MNSFFLFYVYEQHFKTCAQAFLIETLVFFQSQWAGLFKENDLFAFGHRDAYIQWDLERF